jgi:16S rRNA (uracil1498-N3)-methyltransferase
MLILLSLSPGCIGLRTSLIATRRSFRASTACRLNRFLFDPSEVDNTNTTYTVQLPKDDYRTIHAAKILNLHNGDSIRAGIVSSTDDPHGLWTDQATIQWIPQGKVKKAEPLKNGEPPGSLQIALHSLTAPPPAVQPPVSLILALPRPLQLGRLLPMIAQMGVDQLVLTEARKVPKDYFGSHLFRKPYLLRERLIEGLCQAGDVRIPQIHIVRNLRDFVRDDLDVVFPLTDYARVVAHPQRADAAVLPRMRQVSFPCQPSRIVVAVGPEGGWEEPEELEMWSRAGFQAISMGPRILRTDCAVVSLLSLAHDACAMKEQ